jgi:hypothetical protein
MDKLWKFLNAPIVAGIVGAIIVSRGIIIPVLGTQPSIPLTLVVMLIVFLVMTASFYLGSVFVISSFFRGHMDNMRFEGLMDKLRTNQKMPLWWRIIFRSAILMASVNPILWIADRRYRNKRQQQRRREQQEALMRELPVLMQHAHSILLSANWDPSNWRQQHEPPTDTSQ